MAQVIHNKFPLGINLKYYAQKYRADLNNLGIGFSIYE